MTDLLPHRLDRTLVIHARRETVFEFFTDAAQWASWWGAGSTIDARPGGRMWIRYPNGVEVGGEVLEVSSPERISFTYGYVSGTPMPPGASRVTIRLDAHPQGTLLQLTHEFTEAAQRDAHVSGWRFQLSVFANLVATSTVGDAAELIDRWFAAWGTADRESRERTFEAVAAPTIRFEDKFSRLEGLEDLYGHVRGMQQFMPGVRLERRGRVRRSQWTILADWVALAGDNVRASGTNVFTLNPERKIESVIGVWDDEPRSASSE
jgi:uncharacterized protein YndB with AHSA1/START domain